LYFAGTKAAEAESFFALGLAANAAVALVRVNDATSAPTADTRKALGNFVIMTISFFGLENEIETFCTLP
jgi:hypothetical protein